MKLIAQKEAEEFVKTGGKEFRYNRDLRLTPGAKDVFTEAGIKLVFDDGATQSSNGSAAPNPPSVGYAPVPQPPALQFEGSE